MGRNAKIKKKRSQSRREWEQRKDDPVEIKLNVSYRLRPAMREDSKDPVSGRVLSESYFKVDRQVTEFLIRNALAARYPEGSSDRVIKRSTRAITNALNDAVTDKKDSIVLTREQVQHAKEALEAWKVPSDWQGAEMDLEEAIDAALKADADRVEAEKAAKNGTADKAPDASVRSGA